MLPWEYIIPTDIEGDLSHGLLTTFAFHIISVHQFPHSDISRAIIAHMSFFIDRLYS